MTQSHEYEYADGYLEHKDNGRFEGKLSIERVNISPIEGVYFKKGEAQYLWLKRKPILEYDFDTMSYKTRASEPRWETYLEKQNGSEFAYRGTFVFLRFIYSIVGIWDRFLGIDRQRLNFFVERLPNPKQTIINGVNERNKQRNDK